MARKTKAKISYFRKNVPVALVADYAATLLRQIRQSMGQVVSFTRDDLMGLPILEFQQVGFASRYGAIRLAVSYLVEHGELVQMKFPDLCLKDRVGNYAFSETTISSQYAPTIRRLVRAMPPEKPFVVMQVVQRWRTDPELTNDSKRKAVRNGIKSLVREGVCSRQGRFEYIIGDNNE
jgi:hypothetical protein